MIWHCHRGIQQLFYSPTQAALAWWQHPIRPHGEKFSGTIALAVLIQLLFGLMWSLLWNLRTGYPKLTKKLANEWIANGNASNQVKFLQLVRNPSVKLWNKFKAFQLIVNCRIRQFQFLSDLTCCYVVVSIHECLYSVVVCFNRLSWRWRISTWRIGKGRLTSYDCTSHNTKKNLAEYLESSR